MSQSTIIAGCLMLAFLVFITTRGELPAYLYCLGVSPGKSQSQMSGGSIGSVLPSIAPISAVTPLTGIDPVNGFTPITPIQVM